MPVAPSRQDLERIMRRFVVDGTNLDQQAVIPGDSNSPAPNTQYATVKLINSTQVGIDRRNYREIDSNDEELTATTTGWRINTYSVQVYRGDAYGTCATFRQYPHTPDGQLYMEANNFSWVRSGDVLDLDTPVSGEYETRVAMEFSIRYEETVEQVVNKIAQVPVGVRETAETDLSTDTNIDGTQDSV